MSVSEEAHVEYVVFRRLTGPGCSILSQTQRQRDYLAEESARVFDGWGACILGDRLLERVHGHCLMGHWAVCMHVES